MATIPSGTKFIGLSADYPTVERRSALINSESQAYTMQDIIDTVPAGAAVNPTSGKMPYNNGGVFADSGFTYSGPSGFENTILNHTDANTNTLRLDTQNNSFVFGRAISGGLGTSSDAGLGILQIFSSLSLGNAVAYGGYGLPPEATWGMAIDGFNVEAIIGCGTSSPTNGVFRASGAMAATWIGNGGIDNSIGISNNGMFGDAMLVGTNLTLFIGPNLYLMVHIPGVGDKMILLQ